MDTPAAQDDLAEGLAHVVGEAWGAPVSVEALRRLSGGASRETWSFRAVGGDGEGADLILQRERPGGGARSVDLAVEDGVLAAAAAAGVPVPPVVVASDAAASRLGSARVTAAVAGEALGPRLVRAERSEEGRRDLAAAMGRALAGIHAIDVEEHPGLARKDPIGQARLGLDLVGEARPAFEMALLWLAENRPPATPDTVVHGDFRIGNLLVEGDELTGVLDWELVHRGDPLEDLGWLCVRAWRFGGAHEVGGLADLDDLLAAYAGARGVEVDPAHVRWWTAAGTLTWGLICAVQARRHLDGHVRSVELATIGRRIAENEYDLLQLMGVGPTSAPEVVPPPAHHGRPTAEELLDVVRWHLTERVAPLLDGAAAYEMRVVDRALATVQREVARSGVPWPLEDESALAAAIRAGEVEVDDALRASVRAAAVERLRVANPRWLEGPDA